MPGPLPSFPQEPVGPGGKAGVDLLWPPSAVGGDGDAVADSRWSSRSRWSAVEEVRGIKEGFMRKFDRCVWGACCQIVVTLGAAQDWLCLATCTTPLAIQYWPTVAAAAADATAADAKAAKAPHPLLRPYPAAPFAPTNIANSLPPSPTPPPHCNL
jgi:hypothetical protein